jgi:EAL domain-containing protein (putative c-di-GMP-specific phosphodiesterase class I)/CheY-like chemotaxis protein
MEAVERVGRAISVVVADDEPHVVEYLGTVLRLEGFDVAGTGLDADSAVQLVHRLRPDVALLDLRMPGGGLEAARLIGSLNPSTRIVIFSSAADEPDLLPLLRAGIDGYVVKGCSPERLADAIRSAAEGHSYLDPSVNRFAMDQLADRLHAEEQDALQQMRRRDRISRAIATSAYRIVHQPIVELPTGEVRAVEALTRFTDRPHRPPIEWFEDADRAGLRVPLELAVANAAIADLAILRADLSVAVNLSPVTIVSGRLPEILTGVAFDRLIIEVTEHAPVEDYAPLNAALAHWRRNGVRLAVDDAGGGYASFAHILNLSPDLIKLDITLTHDIHADRQRQALARALIAYADEMEVSVVAEGIETTAELAELHGLGVHLGQGFHVGRPRPLDEQPDLLAATGRGPRVLVLPDEVDLRSAEVVLDDIEHHRS